MTVRFAGLLALALIAATGGCRAATDTATATEAPSGTIALTITSGNGAHAFAVEVAKTAEEQERGLMFRTDIPQNGGMLFAPYPPEGGPPRVANFWMKNTPSPLDILFIRPDGTIARIAENTVPQSETPDPLGRAGRRGARAAWRARARTRYCRGRPGDVGRTF